MVKICLLSSERSGSNLLRLMLGSHNQISAPSAPHIISILGKYIHCYGDLENLKNLEELVSDMLSLIEIHPYPWKHKFTVRDIIENIQQTSFWSIWDYLYTLNAELEEKKHWFTKENNLFDYAWEILHHIPDIKFIYLVRDGRDYACSRRSSPGGHCHYYFIAKQWKEEQNRCLNIYQQLKNTGTIHLLYYEKLITEPEKSLQKITNFLGLNYDNNMLEYYQKNSAQEIAKKTDDWKNLSKPLIKTNSNKFKYLMSKTDLKLFESVAGIELQLLNYECLTDFSEITISTWKKLFFKIQDLYMQRINKYQLIDEQNRTQRYQLINRIQKKFSKELKK